MFRVEEIVLISLNFSPVASQEELNDEGVESAENQIDDDADDSDNSTNFKCGSIFDEKEKVLRVILEVFISGSDYPFVLDAEMGGVFRFDTIPDGKTFEMLRHVNCPAIIFPYLREVISDITKRAGLDPLYLAPMNFVEAYKNAKKEK